MAQPAHSAVFSAWLQPQYPQCLRYNHSLLFVVGRWDTLKDLETLQCGGTAGSLVRDHTTDGLVEYPGWGAKMEGTWKSIGE